MTECDTREILEALDSRELNALRNRATWCDFDGRNSKKELLDSMNRAVGTAISQGDLTPRRLVEDIKNKVVSRGPKKIDTQIQEILRETSITNVAQNTSDTEEFACAHLTGVLQGKLGSRFEIEQEKTVGTYKELDIWLQDKITGEEYLIEAKIGKRGRKRLPKQLAEYHSYLNNRKKTYVLFLLLEKKHWKYHGINREKQLNDFLSEKKIETIESIDDDIDIVLNLCPS